MSDSSTLLSNPAGDVQAERPEIRIGLSEVGVMGIERFVRLGPPGAEQNLLARIDCSVDLGAHQRGAHMSRFDEAIEEAIDAAVLERSLRAEVLAADIAERVRERQGSRRAEAHLSLRWPRLRPAPVSGAASHDIHTVLGSAAASESATRRLLGVRAEGMTACPCGQALASADARERLAAEGFDAEEIKRVMGCVPIATHNQRGIGTLWVGRATDAGAANVEPDALLEIVESSMSSEVYERLKRPDEAYIVEKAHRRPRFVEDCVRGMVRLSVERLGDLGEGAFLSARQENLETIHQHDVVAERHGLLADLARELRGEAPAFDRTTVAGWLRGGPATLPRANGEARMRDTRHL